MAMKLSERALLSDLHTSIWGAKSIDREVTDETNQRRGAASNAGRYTKNLIADTFLSEVRQAATRARDTHKTLTLPWGNSGERILSTTAYMTYTEIMRKQRHEFEAAVTRFIANYDEAIEEAKGRLSTMFDPENYAPIHLVPDKFSFDVEIKSVPEAGDFRATLDQTAVDAITKDIEARTDARLDQAMKDIFFRVHDVVSKMSERLKEYKPAGETTSGKVEGRFHDSLVYNVKELAQLLPTLNITQDQRIDDLSKQLLAELTANSPPLLRDDVKLRQSTAAKADRILRKVSQYM
jgi:hypothetical protein